VGGAIAALTFLFVIPVPHRLKSKCEVQPVTRRFVAAPYEGRLEAALVEPGDWVTEGQALARMDAREIRLELASVEADLVRAIKQRDTAMASRETASAQMSHLEMERLELKVQMLKDRMDNLEIKSPTDGVVISGDPKKLEGSRLTMGQTLVEVGPLGEMVLEVGIPDESISYAKIGQKVWFRLESLPRSSFHGVLTRIHPRSEERESDNVFIGEVRIESDNELLRPGMRGRAKISANRRSLFWVLFHRAWEQVLFHLG
jgi:multidrug resistance efflux pump